MLRTSWIVLVLTVALAAAEFPLAAAHAVTVRHEPPRCGSLTDVGQVAGCSAAGCSRRHNRRFFRIFAPRGRCSGSACG